MFDRLQAGDHGEAGSYIFKAEHRGWDGIYVYCVGFKEHHQKRGNISASRGVDKSVRIDVQYERMLFPK